LNQLGNVVFKISRQGDVHGFNVMPGTMGSTGNRAVKHATFSRRDNDGPADAPPA
jgi:hypothetical protein